MTGGTSLASDFARRHAVSIGALASLGYLSTYLPSSQEFTRIWRVTASGALYLERHYA